MIEAKKLAYADMLRYEAIRASRKIRLTRDAIKDLGEQRAGLIDQKRQLQVVPSGAAQK